MHTPISHKTAPPLPTSSTLLPEKQESLECLMNTFETFWNEKDIETCTRLFTQIIEIAPPAEVSQKLWGVLQIAQQKAFDKTTNQKAREVQEKFVRQALQASTAEIITDEALKEEIKPLQRWTRESLPISIYFANPKEAKMLIKMHLHHNISYYGHEIKVGPNKGLEILRNGTYTPLSTIMSELEYKESQLISKKDQKEWN